MKGREEGRLLYPDRYQPPLPVERFLLDESPGDEAVPLDVLVVGGGPAGLATAIELARLAASGGSSGNPEELEIGVLEKAAGLGEHCLSGAVVNPKPFRELFPDVPEEELPFRGRVAGDRVYVLSRRRQLRIPTPPTMRNHGNYVASISEVVRWMGARAEELGVHVFTGFPAGALLRRNGRIVGVRTVPAGLDREGNPGPGYQPPTDLTARLVVLAEGTRGALTQAWQAAEGISSPNPQMYALGVKELWRVKRPLKSVVHTLGWPVPRDAFGGSWFYPMADDLVSLGIVVGLDYRDQTLDVHRLLQEMKEHPLFARHLEGGELLEWGAKTIPEGGYYALPDRLHGDGVLVVGDAAGLVNVASLKGIHYAVQSGILAARVAFEALSTGEATAGKLAPYEARLRDGYVGRDLYRTRNMRLAFQRGFFRGGMLSVAMQLTGGRFPGGRLQGRSDVSVPRRISPAPPFRPDGRRSFAKPDAVYRSGNATRDDIPSHLIVGREIPGEAAEFYAHMCPAAVYERDGERLVLNAPNCVDCKATDVLGPRWTPREGGSGPSYKRM